MATNYSMICWGGRLGKAVAVNATTDVITLIKHGLRIGTGVQFTGGTLPSVSGAALSTNTTYYSKPTNVDEFELYYDVALTSKVDFTSTGSSLILKSAYYQGPSDKSRWINGGVESIYDSLSSWYTARSALCTSFDSEVCEIGMAWTDYGPQLTISMASPATLVTPSIAGIKTPAFHGGVVGAGYSYFGSSNSLVVGVNVKVEGFSCESASGAPILINLNGLGARASYMICARSNRTGTGINFNLALTSATNCLIVGMNLGVAVQSGTNESLVANNTVVNCNTGFSWPTQTNKQGYWYNNLSIGCTNNWLALPTPLQVATGNAGMVGDANLPWAKSPGTYVQIGADWNTTTPLFMDYAAGDYRPWLSGGVPNSNSALLIDAGVDYYNADLFDIAWSPRIAYAGGAPAKPDIGCFEADLGFGPWPASHTLTLQNVVVGSRVHIRDQAKTIVHYDAIAASSTVVVTVTLYGDARDNWFIDIRKASAAPFYKRYTTQMTADAGASSHYVNQPSDQG